MIATPMLISGVLLLVAFIVWTACRKDDREDVFWQTIGMWGSILVVIVALFLGSLEGWFR